MTSPDLTRKVRQLDHDVQEIYVMLADISATQRRHGVRMDEIAVAVEQQGGLLAAHGAKIDVQGAQLATHGAKLDAQGAKIDQILELLRTRPGS
jgi:hypothetical protein